MDAAVAIIRPIGPGRPCSPVRLTQDAYPCAGLVGKPARVNWREARARRPVMDKGLELRGYRLDLGVGVEHFVAHLTAPAGLLVSAERQCRVEHVVAVDPDGAGPDLLGQGVSLGDVPGPDAGAEAVLGIVGDGGDLVHVTARRR